MYAVIKTGGKQYRVEEGAQPEVERFDGDSASWQPVLIVDGSKVVAAPADLAKAAVQVKKVADVRGKKIEAFTYKNKSNNRRKWGHRQELSRIEVTKISLTKRAPAKAKAAAAEDKGE